MSYKEFKTKKKETVKDIRKKQLELQKSKANIKKDSKNNDFNFAPIVRTKSKTSIQTLPYTTIHEQNIVELLNGKFSKIYFFDDINYTSARDDEQYNIFGEYSKFLNSLANDIQVQISIVTKTVALEEVYKNVINTDKDKNNYIDPLFNINLKNEFNEIIKKYFNEGDNTQKTSKYISVSIDAIDIKSAYNRFINIESNITKRFKNISKNCVLKEVEKEDLAHILAEIMRGERLPKRTFSNIDFKRKEEKGYIAPDGIHFFDNYFRSCSKSVKRIKVKEY